MTPENFDAGLAKFSMDSQALDNILAQEANVPAYETLLAEPLLTVESVVIFMRSVSPDALLRNRVGNILEEDFPNSWPSGPEIETTLSALLLQLSDSPPGRLSPGQAYHLFNRLAPFTRHNGICGRAVWLWSMNRRGARPYALDNGFLLSLFHQERFGYCPAELDSVLLQLTTPKAL